MSEHEHVLVVFPHPDDEAFGVAGTILSYTENNIPVTYACLTLGEMGRNMGNPQFANRETLPEVRKQELDNACSLLGINDLRRFGMRDKTIEFEDFDVLTSKVEEVIHEINPSLIITFYPGYAVHPDHDATGEAVIEAVKRLPKQSRPIVYALAFSNNCEVHIGPPDVTLDVSKYAEQKLKVIEAHASQTAGTIEVMKQQFNEQDEAVTDRLMKERFWTYRFDDG
ncbi:bacillithiol biosynthesis deacetylase BshB2 [Texcoconibacillus texcoconensis]|uniref:Bacillithiol biosynthesis deacetylase BshB2 n=1 Tax=Texcoconibacillus texcoconensis TaxID=1095777 RepID=A0A840QS52_9BACI|nr:bacillithiol biosynthesis deacetylase BshB2 [Texcoconibacillus texcoconensis]MBB5174148.1 bacillithiol biosynthesis deacetylase BshB2 [Texcoconibacillus texcoconensis]